MEDYISVNGIKVPITTIMSPNKIRGLRPESMLIISYDCEIPIRVKEYLDSKKIKILRLD